MTPLQVEEIAMTDFLFLVDEVGEEERQAPLREFDQGQRS
jgi:hypothetical protein